MAIKKKKHILASYFQKVDTTDMEAATEIKEVEDPTPKEDSDAVVRTGKFYSYFIYSRKENKIVGNIFLTENQAYILNDTLKHSSGDNQDIAFLRK